MILKFSYSAIVRLYTIATRKRKIYGQRTTIELEMCGVIFIGFLPKDDWKNEVVETVITRYNMPNHETQTSL